MRSGADKLELECNDPFTHVFLTNRLYIDIWWCILLHFWVVIKFEFWLNCRTQMLFWRFEWISWEFIGVNVVSSDESWTGSLPNLWVHPRGRRGVIIIYLDPTTTNQVYLLLHFASRKRGLKSLSWTLRPTLLFYSLQPLSFPFLRLSNIC